MALSSYRTERKFETEITAQNEAFTDNGNSLVFIILILYSVASFASLLCLAVCFPCFGLFFFSSEVFVISVLITESLPLSSLP